jgi:hypothetical protein
LKGDLLLFHTPRTLATREVLDWYELLSSGLSEKQKGAHLLFASRFSFPSYLGRPLVGVRSKNAIDLHFEACQKELEISTSLILIAAAEARIRADALDRKLDGSPLGMRLSIIYLPHATEPWKVPIYDGGIMDEWKWFINSSGIFSLPEKVRMLGAIGEFSRIWTFRNWVAHGRGWNFEKKMPISQFDPFSVADAMDELYDALNAVALRGGLMGFV